MTKLAIPHHSFTATILEMLERHFGEYGKDIFETSSLLGYLNHKTKAANRGSKARGAFANHYALYVVVEDYIHKGFCTAKAKSHMQSTKERGSPTCFEGSENYRLVRNFRIMPSTPV